MRLSLKFLYPLVALLMLTFVLDRKIFQIPPLGKSLNPFVGLVQNEKESISNKEISLNRADQTEIYFDERSVPHIFSPNQEDMFFSQGYVCASDRLWQMDFMSYASAGRLSEIFGKEFLDYDRNQRREGILKAAIESLKFIEADPETKATLDNYTEGVNAYINSLTYADFPVEYKLMDYSPEPWTNLKSVLIMKYLAASLSGYEEDVSNSYTQLVLGKNTYDKLFPSYYLAPEVDSFQLVRLKDSLPEKNYIDYSFLESSPEITASSFNPRHGSNSWVISENKSESGAAILCTDPHLDLTLPAIWYEMQLNSGEQNVYGYSIPGIPGVLIGFNEHISWGLTNGANDVRDYFKLELSGDYSSYRYDDNWVETAMHIEEIKVRDEADFLDTVFYSIHGPIKSDLRFGPLQIQGCALNWTLHEPSNEFLTFIKLNKAENYKEFKSAIQHYKCPVQNFSYADTEGNIGVCFQGGVEQSQWKNQGRFVLDGTQSDYLNDLKLIKDLPQSFNPESGYVLSANNNPWGFLDSILIIGHYTELRANKIASILSGKDKHTLKEMKAMQLDNTNRFAELALPVLLKHITTTNHSLLNKLKKWDYKCTRDSEIGSVFERWWLNIKNSTWDELNRYNHINTLPDDPILLEMIINDPNNLFFDLLSTDEKESASDIIRIAFKQVWENVGIYRNWGEMNKVSLSHLSGINNFGRTGIQQGGHPDAINALSGSWGPSLRMIVEMRDKPKGYGIYAGGQSGNPASTRYESFVDDWANGQYYELKHYSDALEAEKASTHKWIIN